ncbi:Fic family protein [Propionivibrio sp.]|uniref:Fic family protein n=1 Tax=Propionivibrio sp. TaxID=2212460 RepID=UPI003BF16F04
MTRHTLTEDISIIESIIAEFPQGIGISALENALAQRSSTTLNRRTLQRRLGRLIQDQRIVAEGASIALVYKPVPKNSPTQASASAGTSEAELYVPVSPEGAIIRDRVRRPLMHRRPVGYQREFLQAYEPGISFYLSESVRAQLLELGRTAIGERPAGTYAREVLNRLLVDLSWASSRLEGNTYSRLDTLNLIEFGQVAQGKDAQETQMILNHKAAIEMLIEDVDQVAFDAFTFQNLHALLAQNLMRQEEACGRLRRRPVEISGTVFLPMAMPQIIEDCFHMLLQKAQAITDPFEQAFFLMVQLPYLQPFEDVNKRVSRIGANIPLIKHNLCPLSFIDVPEAAYIEGTLGVYELNQMELLRDVFVWAYERSCQRYLAITQTMVEPDPLKIRYREALIEAVQAVIKGLLPPTWEIISGLSRDSAPETDREAFSQMLSDALRQLHEGSVARYKLRRSELLAWQVIRNTSPE